MKAEIKVPPQVSEEEIALLAKILSPLVLAKVDEERRSIQNAQVQI